jgi:signal transduction histidine kinase
MPLRKKRSLKWYFKTFDFIARERLKKNDLDRRVIHTHLVVMMSMGVLMWSYTLLAIFTIGSPVPGIIGFICSIVHFLTPFLFRFTANAFIPTNILLTAGIIHESTFSYFSGGFMSHMLIWFGIFPMIGGVVCGKKGCLTWFFISTLVSLIFFWMDFIGYEFPFLISENGLFWSQALLVFGWTLLSSTIVYVYVGLRQYTENLLHDQSRKIDDLFRVLFHDLANPLSRISIGLSIARKQLPNGENNRGLEIAQLASESMVEVTQNIRRMYAVRKGQGNVDLSWTSLNDSFAYILRIYSPELERKNIQIEYNFEKNNGLHFFVEPVSFNNQVLGNIISNAIKFSPPDSKINVAVYPIHHQLYALEVKDNGIGIPKEMINQLFDINKKTGRPGTQGETGAGFGLHIMKSFIDMYGGNIHIESKVSSGDTPSGTNVKLILRGQWN